MTVVGVGFSITVRKLDFKVLSKLMVVVVIVVMKKQHRKKR